MAELDWTAGELAAGLRCYRAQEFFEAHEHWEMVWLQSPEPQKTFLQALIQMTAAFHHFQRGNLAGTTSLLRESLRKLECYGSSFGRISLTTLCPEIREWLRVLEDNIVPTALEFPQIRVD